MINKTLIYSSITLIFLGYFSNDTLAQTNKTGLKNALTNTKSSTITSNTSSKVSSLTNTDVSTGLKEALEVGITNATKELSAVDGFYKNPTVKILFPPEVQNVEKKLRAIGMGSLVDDAILKMNRAAEDATSKAVPILFDAVGSINFTDAMGILTGGNTAATRFLQQKSSAPLTTTFTPIVEASLNKTGATVAWKAVFDAYNKIPFIKPVNSNLTTYVTEKSLDGLFYTIGEEEVKIRKNPGKQSSNAIQKVFGAK